MYHTHTPLYLVFLFTSLPPSHSLLYSLYSTFSLLPSLFFLLVHASLFVRSSSPSPTMFPLPSSFFLSVPFLSYFLLYFFFFLIFFYFSFLFLLFYSFSLHSLHFLLFHSFFSFFFPLVYLFFGLTISLSPSRSFLFLFSF